MRFSTVLFTVGVNAYYGVDQTPTRYQLDRFWTESRSFEGHTYGFGTPNPCTYDGMKDEEPWATVCVTPHKLCNYVDVDGDEDGVKKWSTYHAAVMTPSDSAYAYHFSTSSLNGWDSQLTPFYNNDYGNNEGEIPPGLKFNPMPTFTVTMRGKERQIFYQCKQYENALQALYGASYKKFKNQRQLTDKDICDADSCNRDHAIMMTDTVSKKRYWVSTHGGTVTCSGARFDETSDGFSPLIRDHPSTKWADIADNIAIRLPWHSGSGTSMRIAAYAETIRRKDACSAAATWTLNDYLMPTQHMYKYWDEHMKVYPSRIIVEDDKHNLYTWLKVHSYDGPFTSAFDTDDYHTTTCGKGELTGWGDWLSNYTIREHQTAAEFCLMTVGCYPKWSWRMNTASHTTWKWTDKQVADISRCHDHIYVPENATHNTWSTKVCQDARGCISAKFSFNPCIYDFRPGQLADTDGVVDLVASNITWPRGGTWDSKSKTMTFNDNPGLATKDTYPIASVTLNADGSNKFNQEFNCTSEGGWFGGDGHKVGWFGPEANDRSDHRSGQLNNPGRKRRVPLEKCAPNTGCSIYDIVKRKMYTFLGYTTRITNQTIDGKEVLFPPLLFGDWMDENFPNYFDDASFPDDGLDLAWAKWGAWVYLDGYTDGGDLSERLQNGAQGLFIGISNIVSYEDSWDIRYPICKGDQCPDSCDVGTTADVTILCTNEFNFNRWSNDVEERGYHDGLAAEAYITVKAGDGNTPGTSCSYDISIEVDCDPYIVFFSRNPGEDFDEDWNGNPQLLSDPSILIANYEKRKAAGGPTDVPPPTQPPILTEPWTESSTEAPTEASTEAPSTDAPATDAPGDGAAHVIVCTLLVLLCVLL